MKKILFVITKSNWGGAQRYVFDLATNLPKNEYEVVVALGGTGAAGAGEGTLSQRLMAAGVRTIFVQSFMRDISVWRDRKAVRELKAIVAAERPDVVHLNSSKAGGLGAWAARRTHWRDERGVKHRAKIIFTSHGLPWDEDRGVVSRAAIWLASWITFLLCDVVVTINRDNAARAALPWCSSKIRLVHNGAAPVAFAERSEARRALGLDDNTLVVGTIANLEWNKGLQYLVRAAGDLARAGKNFAVCIVGEGEERTFLTTLISDESLEPVVRLAGFVPDAARYLSAFDIFCLPSVKEGLPYVLLEAGQAGLPCLGSNIPGVTEIIGTGVSGLTFRTKDHHNLAAKLSQLIDDPGMRERLGNALKQRVEQEFSIEKMVTSTASLY